MPDASMKDEATSNLGKRAGSKISPGTSNGCEPEAKRMKDVLDIMSMVNEAINKIEAYESYSGSQSCSEAIRQIG